MTTSLSQMLITTDGRWLSAIESESLYAKGLELESRLIVSQLMQERESLIVEFATTQFCETVGDFEGPAGSLRRKKGHQDGRIMLRYIGQSIREGSTAPLFEKVLSWLVGHLDEQNVTGRHLEIFLHFLEQGALRELPDFCHSFVEEVFKSAIAYIRLSTDSGTIMRAHRRIAEETVQRVFAIMPDAKITFGASTLPKCKRDIEFVVKEFARLLHAETEEEVKEAFAGWLLDRVLTHVSYPADVWYWTLLCMQEAIVKCCGPMVGFRTFPILDSLAGRCEHLVTAVEIISKSASIAEHTAEMMLSNDPSLGIYREDEFKVAASSAHRQLLQDLAVLHASGVLFQNPDRVFKVWSESIAKQPSWHREFLASGLKSLVNVAREKLSVAAMEMLREGLAFIIEIARLTEVASNLSTHAEKAIDSGVQKVYTSSDVSASSVRRCARDLRLVLSRIIMNLPFGVSGRSEFKHDLTKHLLCNSATALRFGTVVFDAMAKSYKNVLLEHESKIALEFFREAGDCTRRFGSLAKIPEQGHRMIEDAVHRSFSLSPNSTDEISRGVAAGVRDGKFLLRKLMLAAVVGDEEATQRLHWWFQEEIVRFSMLPGRIIVDFLRGMHESLKTFPEMGRLLEGLIDAAPGYAAGMKIFRESTAIAQNVASSSIHLLSGYRERIGDTGSSACQRDLAYTLRGLAHFMLRRPDQPEEFARWWRTRVGRFIVNLPPDASAIDRMGPTNMTELLRALDRTLDQAEARSASRYIKAAFKQLPEMQLA